MNFTYDSLKPVAVSVPTEKHLHRTFQGIPGIARTRGGRLFVTWYAGGWSECRDNFSLLAFSDDDGYSWTEPVAVVDPPFTEVRSFDPTLWRAPDGRIYWFWAQGCGSKSGVVGILDEVFDGLEGVWYSILENPDAPKREFRFSAPRRISNGIMLNKPQVFSDGKWVLPCSLWSLLSKNRKRHESLMPLYGAIMLVSSDKGENFSVQGAVDVTKIPGGESFDEHQFLELANGTIHCYIRAQRGIARVLSRDGGRNWEVPELTSLPGPNCRFSLMRLSSGRVLLVTNNSMTKRERLTAFLSEDEGVTWPYSLLLDERVGVSYPDGIQNEDGSIDLVYDFERFKGGYIYRAKVTEADIIGGHCGDGTILRQEINHSEPVPPGIITE